MTLIKTENRIYVEKKLHMENAMVTSIGYTSFTKPVLAETVTLIGGKGGEIMRVSTDNGRTWTKTGDGVLEEMRGDRIIRRYYPVYHLDSDHGILIEFFTEYERGADEKLSFGPEAATMEILEFRTARIFYRFSKDDGETWGSPKQLIQKGAGYDDVHWADGIYYGKNSGYFAELMRAIKLKDGAIIVPICFWRLDDDGKMIKWPDRFGDLIWPIMASACFRGCWRNDMSDLEWEMSNHVTLPEYMSRDVDEPAVAELDNGNLMMLMRGGACAWQTMPSVKFYAISKDGGRTWGPAVPLTYPDGSFAYSPGSLANLFRSSKNGRMYLIANILPGPCRQCDPRYPLVIAEVDQKYYWVLPETVTVIDDRQPHHPKGVRFSNWQRIEDRETGNPIIYMTEALIDAIIPDTEGTISPHSYSYEIKLPEK